MELKLFRTECLGYYSNVFFITHGVATWLHNCPWTIEDISLSIIFATLILSFMKISWGNLGCLEQSNVSFITHGVVN